MEATTKKLQELGAFVLAGAHEPHQLCMMAEMIRAACDYRWVGIYKITRGDFVIVAKTGKCPPAYPRFPITQGLAARHGHRITDELQQSLRRQLGPAGQSLRTVLRLPHCVR